MKRCLLIFVALLIACSHSSYEKWSNNCVEGSSSLSKLIYKDNLTFPEIELEFIKNGDKTFGYLNLCFDTFSKKNGNFAKVNFTIGDFYYSKDLPLLKGGQRVKLDDSLCAVLIDALKQNKVVKIEVGEMVEIVDNHAFNKKYTTFLEKSNFSFSISPEEIKVEAGR